MLSKFIVFLLVGIIGVFHLIVPGCEATWRKPTASHKRSRPRWGRMNVAAFRPSRPDLGGYLKTQQPQSDLVYSYQLPSPAQPQNYYSPLQYQNPSKRFNHYSAPLAPMKSVEQLQQERLELERRELEQKKSQQTVLGRSNKRGGHYGSTQLPTPINPFGYSHVPLAPMKSAEQLEQERLEFERRKLKQSTSQLSDSGQDEMEQGNLGQNELEQSQIEQGQSEQRELEESEVDQNKVEQNELEASELEGDSKQDEQGQNELELNEMEQNELKQSELQQSEHDLDKYAKNKRKNKKNNKKRRKRCKKGRICRGNRSKKN